MSAEKYIAGFHSRLDKLSYLAMDDKLKVHLLLRQARLDSSTWNIILGGYAGNYDISKISASLLQAFCNKNNHSHNPTGNHSRGGRRCSSRNRDRDGRGGRSNRVWRNGNGQHQPHEDRNNSGRSVFYTYSFDRVDEIPGAIINSGARSSVVRQSALDAAMKQLCHQTQ